MKKSDKLYKTIVKDISEKKYGSSGSRCITTRELSNRYNVSLVTAHKIKQLLIENNNIRQIGKKCFLTTGAFDNESDVQKIFTRTKTIGFHFSKINNQYFSDIATYASEYAHKLGYNMAIMVSNNDEEAEKAALDQFFNMRVVGVISYEGAYADRENQLYKNYPLPVVFLSSDRANGKSDISTVDNNLLSMSIATHLVEQGYKKFLFVTNSRSVISQTRQNGFEKELNKHGYSIENKDNVFFDGNLSGAFYLMLKKVLASGDPVGIFCYHDILAAAVMDLCIKHDIACPQQVGIVGFDNLSDLPYDDITSVEYSKNSVVKQAIDVLVNKNQKDEFETKYISGYLIIRRSSSLRKN